LQIIKLTNRLHDTLRKEEGTQLDTKQIVGAVAVAIGQTKTSITNKSAMATSATPFYLAALSAFSIQNVRLEEILII
jgi:hypothetical protein